MPIYLILRNSFEILVAGVSEKSGKMGNPLKRRVLNTWKYHKPFSIKDKKVAELIALGDLILNQVKISND